MEKSGEKPTKKRASEMTKEEKYELYATDSRYCGYYGGHVNGGFRGNTDPCGNWAGARTDTPGVGKCWRCGRFGGGRPPGEKRLGDIIRYKAKEILQSDEDPMDLRQIIAEQRAVNDLVSALLEPYVLALESGESEAPTDANGKPVELDLKQLERLLRLSMDFADKIGKNIERHERIQQAQRFGPHEFRALVAGFRQIILMAPSDLHEPMKRGMYDLLGIKSVDALPPSKD